MTNEGIKICAFEGPLVGLRSKTSLYTYSHNGLDALTQSQTCQTEHGLVDPALTTSTRPSRALKSEP